MLQPRTRRLAVVAVAAAAVVAAGIAVRQVRRGSASTEASAAPAPSSPHAGRPAHGPPRDRSSPVKSSPVKPSAARRRWAKWGGGLAATVAVIGLMVGTVAAGIAIDRFHQLRLDDATAGTRPEFVVIPRAPEDVIPPQRYRPPDLYQPPYTASTFAPTTTTWPTATALPRIPGDPVTEKTEVILHNTAGERTAISVEVTDHAKVFVPVGAQRATTSTRPGHRLVKVDVRVRNIDNIPAGTDVVPYTVLVDATGRTYTRHAALTVGVDFDPEPRIDVGGATLRTIMFEVKNSVRLAKVRIRFRPGSATQTQEWTV